MSVQAALLTCVMFCSFCSGACGIIGPSCLDRRQTGTVATVSGDVEPGAIRSHLVPYETKGSQNDGNVSWTGQAAPGGPRLTFYATMVACEDFNPFQIPGSGPCSTLSRAGSVTGGIASTLIVTNGRGNPDVLGNPAQYKIWVAGDPEQRGTYTIHITWFFGPDC